MLEIHEIKTQNLIFNNFEDCIFCTDLNGTIIFFNSLAEDALGYKADEIINKTSSEIFFDSSEKSIHSLKLSKIKNPIIENDFIFRNYASQIFDNEKEWIFIRKNKTTFTSILNVSLLIDSKNNEIGFKFLIQNKDIYLPYVRSEIFNPLDLIQVTNYVIASLKTIIIEKKISLNFNTDLSKPHYFFGDSIRISQILFELINYSIKYTPDFGIINLNLKIDEVINQKQNITIEITDNGIGISSENINTIFEESSLVNDTYTTTGETSFGLKKIKKEIASIYGQIMVSSKINEGSILTLSFPLKIDENYTKIKHKIEESINYSIMPSIPNIIS